MAAGSFAKVPITRFGHIQLVTFGLRCRVIAKSRRGRHARSAANSGLHRPQDHADPPGPRSSDAADPKRKRRAQTWSGAGPAVSAEGSTLLFVPDQFETLRRIESWPSGRNSRSEPSGGPGGVWGWRKHDFGVWVMRNVRCPGDNDKRLLPGSLVCDEGKLLVHPLRDILPGGSPAATRVAFRCAMTLRSACTHTARSVGSAVSRRLAPTPSIMTRAVAAGTSMAPWRSCSFHAGGR
jgi:hypothetical protein